MIQVPEPSGKRRRENSRSEESPPKIITFDDNPLCCCEYINEKGERSHVLGFCCDCETLDDSFERLEASYQITQSQSRIYFWEIINVLNVLMCRLIQGQPQPKGRYKEICTVFCDRFRFPWINGARKVDLEVLLPALVVPAAMWIGTFGAILTVFSFIFILVAIHVIRKCMLLRKRGTKFYCSFTLTSFILSYLVREAW